jgi:hypothetical protein
MREMSSITSLHVTVDHRYLTRPELDRCVAAVLAHTPHPLSFDARRSILTKFCAFLLKKFGTVKVHIPAEKDV